MEEGHAFFLVGKLPEVPLFEGLHEFVELVVPWVLEHLLDLFPVYPVILV